eukprot:9292746-Heterocapsa_arctica.AAC.1
MGGTIPSKGTRRAQLNIGNIALERRNLCRNANVIVLPSTIGGMKCLLGAIKLVRKLNLLFVFLSEFES